MHRSTQPLRKRLISTGFTALLCALSPAALLAADDKGGGSDQGGSEGGRPGVFMVSDELFDVLEQWSGKTLGYEEIVLDTYPEVVHSYVDSVRGLYRGLTLGEHFTEQYPEAAKEYTLATEREIDDDAEFIAYVMGHRPTDYQRWQGETTLRGSTFNEHIAQYHPEVVAQAEFESVTPADKGISLGGYIRELGKEDLADELDKILNPPGFPPPPPNTCECWVAMATPSQPYNPEIEALEVIDDAWGFIPRKKKQLTYSVVSFGVARWIKLHRMTKHHLWEQDRTKGANHSRLRVRMHCTKDGVAGGLQCEGASCTGELALGVEYASRVREEVDVKGLWSKRARSVAADTAFLRYDPPGPNGEMILFEKGVGVSGDTSTNWNPESVIQTLVAGTQLAVNIAEDGTDGIEQDLVNEFLNGVFNLTTREGDPGTHSEDMFVRFDTANSVPFALTPNTTHLFQLDTQSHVYSRGYGKKAETWADVNSSKMLTGVTRNFQCSGGAQAPTPGACWLWASADGPHSSSTLQGLVSDFVFTELGVTPDGVDLPRNCYPPQ